jgi:hypothetical protein
MKTQFNTNNLLGVMTLILAVTLPLSGCNDNDDDYVMPVSEQLANQDANSEPGSLNDAAAIKAGIEGTFGDPDSEPVDIGTGESIGDVFTKAGS